MKDPLNRKHYHTLLSKIQDRIQAAQKSPQDTFTLYLDIGRLVLCIEKENRHDPVMHLRKDLHKYFSSSDLSKMRALFLAYKSLVQIAFDLKIEAEGIE